MPLGNTAATPRTHPTDGGPMYFETNLDALVQEPLNMATNALFIALAWYWTRRLGRSSAKPSWVLNAMPLLWVASVSGTVYHGFRLHSVFFVLDVLPIFAFLLVGAWRFWWYWTKSSTGATAAVAAASAAQVSGSKFLSSGELLLSYLASTAALLIPVAALSRKFPHLCLPFVLSLAGFAVAVAMRLLDPYGVLPFGTHVFWHIFGVVATHFTLVLIEDYERIRTDSLPSTH